MKSPNILVLNKNGRGFTLIEVVIVIALLGVLLGVGLLMGIETFKGTMYRSERATIVSALQKARSRAMANIDQSAWSVCYIDPNYIIAKGATCSAATAYDSIKANTGVAAASNFATTFPTVSFAQLSGDSADATITITQDGQTKTVVINHAGTISW